MAKDKVVYIVGAGFSVGIGYPMTANLLVEVWPRLASGVQSGLEKVIKFHHAAFDPKRNTSFPYIEDLLTEINVNLEMFDSSRSVVGNFREVDLKEVREGLLTAIAIWFHDLYPESGEPKWLKKISSSIQKEKATVISFNWDLVLDQMLFGNDVSPANYGLSADTSGPILLKPHGSLNWYESNQITNVSEQKLVELYPKTKLSKAVKAFVHPRHIISKAGRRYTPLIVPPTYLKDFNRPISHAIWRRCTDALSVAKKIYFLGYSLPVADLHAYFILRCGFHNQLEGILDVGGRRGAAVGAAEVIVVNPDAASARRIEGVAGPKVKMMWNPMKVEDWVDTL